MHKHWGSFAAFIAAAALAVAGAVFVFVWFTGNIQAVGLVPSTLSLWSMGDVLTFIVQRHLLGTHPNRHPSCSRRSHRLAMVETPTRNRKTPISQLKQKPQRQRRRWSHLTAAIHCIRPQSLHRRKLEPSHRKLELRLRSRLHGNNTTLDSRNLRSPRHNSVHLVGYPRKEQKL